MKHKYTFGYIDKGSRTVTIDLYAYNILDAKMMAIEWMKQNYVFSGWILTSYGKKFFIYW